MPCPDCTSTELAKVNDRLAVWRQNQAECEVPRHLSCKSERPLSGLETFLSFLRDSMMSTCKSERPLSGLETGGLGPNSERTSTCKSERPLSGLETSDSTNRSHCSGWSCKSERPLSGLETVVSASGCVGWGWLAKVNDRLAVWRRWELWLLHREYDRLAKVNDRLAVWRQFWSSI